MVVPIGRSRLGLKLSLCFAWTQNVASLHVVGVCVIDEIWRTSFLTNTQNAANLLYNLPSIANRGHILYYIYDGMGCGKFMNAIFFPILRNRVFCNVSFRGSVVHRNRRGMFLYNDGIRHQLKYPPRISVEVCGGIVNAENALP